MELRLHKVLIKKLDDVLKKSAMPKAEAPVIS
jgi:hypothetical protein